MTDGINLTLSTWKVLPSSRNEIEEERNIVPREKEKILREK